jgi:hypothetical protein
LGKTTFVEEKRSGAGNKSEAVISDSQPGSHPTRLQKSVVMKVYLLVYDEDIREKSLLQFLDSRDEILDWMTILPASVLLVTQHSLRQLTKILSN